MSRRIVIYLLSFVLCPLSLMAQEDSLQMVQPRMAKPSIYGGTIVKLDIASPIVIPLATKWQVQHYEMAVNVRLAQRFYPTIELGYAGGIREQGDTVAYRGQGGFIRLGADLNPLKKHPESPHALLVGLRFGTAVQAMEQTENGYTRSLTRGIRGDCWGEIVAGCQVEIAKVNNTAFYMGWMGRFKFLFTRAQAKSIPTHSEDDKTQAYILTPIYIPGYGARDNIGWGISYHLGWKF